MKNLFYLFVVLSLLNACTPDYSEVAVPPKVQLPTEFSMVAKPKIKVKEIIKDDFTPPGGFKKYKRPLTKELQEASANASKGKGRGKPTRPPKDTTTYQPPTDTTGNNDGGTNPPPTTSEPDWVIFYDFDGGYVKNSYWNANGAITLAPSGMTTAEIDSAMSLMIHDYAKYNVLITADSTEFFKRPMGKRQRIYVTTTWEFYGQAGGVAYLGSINWADDTPAFVFSSLLGYSGKYIGEAGSHEAGHTAGLRHQAHYVDGVKTTDYSTGVVANKAPTMGVGYYDNDAEGSEFVPFIPTVYENQQILNSFAAYQDDHAILTNLFGLRK